jgi:uncharacterized protein YfaP (DUF2135 family)
MLRVLGRIAWILLAALSAATTTAQVVIETPRAGWRRSQGERAGFVQPVSYPASSVNTENADPAALIAGRIKAATTKSALLVVNGISMPLHVGEDGAFARPYFFAPGSNSVEVRADGCSARRQFYDSYMGKTPVKLRVVLSWDADATDVDLHVVSPLGEHAFYGDRVMESGGAIDVDVTTGYGPEIFAHPSPPHGIYHVYVNYYGSGEQPEGAIITSQVAIVCDEGGAREKTQVFQIPLRQPGELTLVHSFVYP